MKANWSDKKWRGQDIKKGQFLTGRIKLSEETGLTQQQVRTSLKKLESTNNITIKTTNRNSIIEVINYNQYQEVNQQTTKQATNKQPTDNQQVTTTNNINKTNKNNNNIVSSEIATTKVVTLKDYVKQDFDSDFLFKLNSNYNLTGDEFKQECRKFIFYWTEKNPRGKKERWEKEKTFDPKRRFTTWLGNNEKWKKKNNNTEIINIT